MNDSQRIAVISDTHGVLPKFVADALAVKPVIRIIHAGDICSPKIVADLQRIAPVTCVRGNMDSLSTGNASEVVEVNGFLFYVLHNLYDIDIDPKCAGVHAVIHGHLHRPSIEWKNDVLYLNPGSCAYPRGNHPPSFAFIDIGGTRLSPEIIYHQ